MTAKPVVVNIDVAKRWNSALTDFVNDVRNDPNTQANPAVMVALKSMQDATITAELLRATGLGLAVHSLSQLQSADQSLRSMALSIVSRFKQQVASTPKAQASQQTQSTAPGVVNKSTQRNVRELMNPMTRTETMTMTKAKKPMINQLQRRVKPSAVPLICWIVSDSSQLVRYLRPTISRAQSTRGVRC